MNGSWLDMRQGRPNILFVVADQFRQDALGIVGGYAETPQLEAIAAEGVLFTQCFTTSPHCVPARASLALGQYPHQIGIWQNRPDFVLPTDAPNWMQAVRNAGYRTSLFGKTHLHPHHGDLRDREHLMHAYGLDDVHEVAGPHASASSRSYMTDFWQEHGVYDAYRRDNEQRQRSRSDVRPSPLGLEFYYDVYVGQKAAAYLAAYDRPEPWMCWVSFPGPHEPWDAPPPYDTMYDPSTMPAAIPRALPRVERNCVLKDLMSRPGQHHAPQTAEHIARLRANYAGNVTLIDDQIAKIVDVLKSRGEYDDTLIVFTSDHGEMNGDHGLLFKGNFLDPAVRIPFIVRPPASMRTRLIGQHSAALTEIMDVGATLMDYAAAVIPPSFMGQSVRPVVEGQAPSLRTSVLSEFKHERMLADHAWKIVLDASGEPVLLFNRLNDPDELVNLLDDFAYSDVAQVLSRQLQGKIAENL
jgi:choline-sulfatase